MGGSFSYLEKKEYGKKRVHKKEKKYGKKSMGLVVRKIGLESSL